MCSMIEKVYKNCVLYNGKYLKSARLIPWKGEREKEREAYEERMEMGMCKRMNAERLGAYFVRSFTSMPI